MAKNKSMYKFEIIEAIIKALDCSSKEQVVKLAVKMRDIAVADETLSKDITDAFESALEELTAPELTLDNIKEIKAMLD